MEERNETVNWANSLSRQCTSMLFFSPYSLYTLAVFSFVLSFHLSHAYSRSRRRGRFISYLLNFIKHPGRQHGRIFHFLVSKGAEGASVVENGERGEDDYVGPLSRRSSFFLRSSSFSPFFSLSLSFFYSLVPVYI